MYYTGGKLMLYGGKKSGTCSSELYTSSTGKTWAAATPAPSLATDPQSVVVRARPMGRPRTRVRVVFVNGLMTSAPSVAPEGSSVAVSTGPVVGQRPRHQRPLATTSVAGPGAGRPRDLG